MKINHNYKILKSIINRPVSTFHALGKYQKTSSILKSNSGYTFIDNHSNILAVAHLDTVSINSKTSIVYDYSLGNIVYSHKLDDRLGVYILLHVLPLLGVKFDVLLTENEEIGQSTAMGFTTDKKYKWVFEFDRHGDDVVMYNLECKTYNDLMNQYKFNVGVGSFSDIVSLYSVDSMKFNFGTGYISEHSDKCYAIMGLVDIQIQKFVNFYQDYKNTSLPIINDTVKSTYSYYDKSAYKSAYKSHNYLSYPIVKPSNVCIKSTDKSKNTCDICDNPITYEQFLIDGLCDVCSAYSSPYPTNCSICGNKKVSLDDTAWIKKYGYCLSCYDQFCTKTNV